MHIVNFPPVPCSNPVPPCHTPLSRQQECPGTSFSFTCLSHSCGVGSSEPATYLPSLSQHTLLITALFHLCLRFTQGPGHPSLTDCPMVAWQLGHSKCVQDRCSLACSNQACLLGAALLADLPCHGLLVLPWPGLLVRCHSQVQGDSDRRACKQAQVTAWLHDTSFMSKARQVASNSRLHC